MAKIYVSGLINIETSARVRGFPIEYYPIDYPFFGIGSAVSGVACNIARALLCLGDEVKLASMVGRDLQAGLIMAELRQAGLDSRLVRPVLEQTPASVVLYDDSGRRQIYCDLKDIQEREYPCDPAEIADCDIVAACNINFNRSLLREAQRLGKPIATDVHVFGDPDDGYNRDFLEAADIVFLSDEALPCPPEEFLYRLRERFPAGIIVLGRGEKGAMIYQRRDDSICSLPCVPAQNVVNTVGAGDALYSAFLHFYAGGMEPVEALWHAQVFASAKIGHSGASRGFISEAEVRRRRKQL